MNRHRLCRCDVPSLRRLVSTAEQDHQLESAPGEIHPVARPEINPQLEHASTNGFLIAEVAKRQTLDPAGNHRTAFDITQVFQLFGEYPGLADFQHGRIVSYGRHMVKPVGDHEQSGT